MDAVRTMTVGAVDLGEVPSVPSAIVKCHVTEMARQVANDAMDVHGGKGIMLGPKNYLGRGYQAVPVAITVEGANILTRSMIIFGQGAIRCHPWVLKEMRAADLDDPRQALDKFDEALWGHIGFAFSNAARSLVLSATHARWTHAPVDGPTRRYYQHINRYSAAFALVADFSMLTLGGSLKFREKISARLGDMLSYLYIASAVLKHYEDNGRQPDDLPFVHWACRTMIYRLQEQMHGLLRNFPNQVVAGLLRVLVFPMGRKYSAPSDQTGRDIVDLLISPSPARARLCAGIYIGPEDQQIGLLTKALELAHQAEPIEKRLRIAQKEGKLPKDDRVDLIQVALDRKVLDATEAALLRELDRLAMQVVHVDDFDHMELGTKPVPAAG
jgi:acyl-CoA dehydrogenase